MPISLKKEMESAITVNASNFSQQIKDKDVKLLCLATLSILDNLIKKIFEIN